MKIIIGLILAVAGLFAATIFLEQEVQNFYDEVALVVVGGGTIAVALMTAPSIRLKSVLFFIISGFKANGDRRARIIAQSVKVLKGERAIKSDPSLESTILEEGIELHQLGISLEKIKSILNLKVIHYEHDGMAVSLWLKSISKYPPAFGLAGTVLGLIHLMRNMSESSSPTQTGLLMSVALLATFYGVVLSNLLFSPLAERIKANIEEDITLGEIGLMAVELYCSKANLLEAQEFLNSYLVNSGEKINVISTYEEVA